MRFDGTEIAISYLSKRGGRRVQSFIIEVIEAEAVDSFTSPRDQYHRDSRASIRRPESFSNHLNSQLTSGDIPRFPEQHLTRRNIKTAARTTSIAIFNTCLLSPISAMEQQSATPDSSKLDRTSKENRWYYTDLTNHLPTMSRKLLEEYSQIPAEDVDSHVYKVVLRPTQFS